MGKKEKKGPRPLSSFVLDHQNTIYDPETSQSEEIPITVRNSLVLASKGITLLRPLPTIPEDEEQTLKTEPVVPPTEKSRPTKEPETSFRLAKKWAPPPVSKTHRHASTSFSRAETFYEEDEPPSLPFETNRPEVPVFVDPIVSIIPDLPKKSILKPMVPPITTKNKGLIVWILLAAAGFYLAFVFMMFLGFLIWSFG